MSVHSKKMDTSNHFTIVGIISICIVFASSIFLFIINSFPFMIIPIILLGNNNEGFQDAAKTEAVAEQGQLPLPAKLTQEMCTNIKDILNQYLKAKEEFVNYPIKGLDEVLATLNEQLHVGSCDQHA